MNALNQSIKEFIRSGGYAWPGGYQCALMMFDGGVIDAQAAHENFKLIIRANKREPGFSRDWAASSVFIHWKGEPLICAHSGRAIPSAYGEV